MIKRNFWTEEEILLLKNNYELSGGNAIFELLHYRHSKNSITKKASSMNLKIDKTIHYFDLENIKNVVMSSSSFSEVFRKLNKSKSGDSYKVIRNYIIKNNIDISHFDPYKNNRIPSSSRSKPIDFWLQSGTTIHSVHLKEKLYESGLKEKKCELCGQGEEWNGRHMSLILDHINGINDDNRIQNLRIVCPNCNATLDTHCGKNKKRRKMVALSDLQRHQKYIDREMKKCECGSLIYKNSNFCKKCYDINQRKVKERPSLKNLLDDRRTLGLEGTGRKYGVTGNCIKKWIKIYQKYN